MLWIISITLKTDNGDTCLRCCGLFSCIQAEIGAKVVRARLVAFVSVPLLILLLGFSIIINATMISLQESYSVITAGETTSGQKDTRLSLRGRILLLTGSRKSCVGYRL